jgi:N-acetylmuramoyl-L-alanine amidase
MFGIIAPASSLASLTVLKAIQRKMNTTRTVALNTRDLTVKGLAPSRVREANAGDYYVLRNTSLPAVLVECGFLSNAQEEKQLLDAAYHRRIAQAVADGLEKWLELQKGL